MTLDELLSHARINHWTRWLWFRDAELNRDKMLLTPDGGVASTIRRCFLPQLQQVIPDLQVVVMPPVPVPRMPVLRSQKLPRQRDIFDEGESG